MTWRGGRGTIVFKISTYAGAHVHNSKIPFHIDDCYAISLQKAGFKLYVFMQHFMSLYHLAEKVIFQLRLKLYVTYYSFYFYN